MTAFQTKKNRLEGGFSFILTIYDTDDIDDVFLIMKTYHYYSSSF